MGKSMKIAVVGGGLQGVEVCILARKAGWGTVLFDKSAQPLALHLADQFFCLDMEEAVFNREKEEMLKTALRGVSVVVPALENDNALSFLVKFCKEHGLVLAFDEKAYAVTSSKVRSRDFFLSCKTPIPTPAFEGETVNFPLIAKPSKGSGSQGVKLLHNEAELLAYLPEGIHSRDWIIESYCPGRQFSMEICGTPNKYRTFQLTELLMDEVFDCRGVTAPADNAELAAEVSEELIKLAQNLSLHGIMDIELVLTDRGMRVFELDARFPSQTPLAVYYSTGVNLLEEFVSCFIDCKPAEPERKSFAASYFHIARKGDRIYFPGEHDLTMHGPLRLVQGITGTEEVLLGGTFESKNWSAVLFLQAENNAELERKKNLAVSWLTQ